MRALNLLRPQVVYRRDSFNAGLKALGYTVVDSLPNPKIDDVLVIWNRYSQYDQHASRFEAAGARVFVAENAYISDLPGGSWVSLALSHHAGAGWWKEGSPSRWDSFRVELLPWRHVNDGETVILGQRGIGEPGIASPINWAELVKRKIGGRIRLHPGKNAPAIPLEQDLAKASSVVTWASSAALKALIAGIPVWYEMPKWIGAGACRPVSEFGQDPKRDDEARAVMFRRLAWAQWSLLEIQSGIAFRHLLC